MTFKEIVDKINEELEEPYKFHLDLIHYHDNSNHVEFLGYSDSIEKDPAVIPKNLQLLVIPNKVNFDIAKWINRRLFTELLKDVGKKMLTQRDKKLIHLRIATNMAIDTTINLTKEQKIEWAEHIKIVFYKRLLAIDNFYCREILGIPF